jgi:hypothetical protein
MTDEFAIARVLVGDAKDDLKNGGIQRALISLNLVDCSRFRNAYYIVSYCNKTKKQNNSVAS